MSLPLGLWLLSFVLLTALSLVRPAWGVSVYLLTFFASPSIWWWGTPVAAIRWNLLGGLILLCAVLVSTFVGPPRAALTRGGKWVLGLSLAMLANMTFVHFCLANSLGISAISYLLQAKFILLTTLIVSSIRNRADFQIILVSIVLGASYIGYEVTLNDRGSVRGNRLEGVGAPNATAANELGSLIVTTLPLTGALFLAGRTWHRIVAVLTAPLILNVALLCNSRGAFLASFSSAVALLVMSPARIRKRAVTLLALGAVAVWLMLGDPRIVDRFMSSFVDAEDRDSSAAGRLIYWRAGFDMIADHPLGAGGAGFKRVYGPRYIGALGPQFDVRAVHNGYINEMCEWGIQGLVLRMALIVTGFSILVTTCRNSIARNHDRDALTAATLIACLAAFLASSVFGDFLDSEWGWWIIALGVGLARVQSDEEEEAAHPEHLEDIGDPIWVTDTAGEVRYVA